VKIGGSMRKFQEEMGENGENVLLCFVVCVFELREISPFVTCLRGVPKAERRLLQLIN
jgi:hypothetical protein